MAKSIGIDLGTTNSVVAIKKVYTEVLKNAEGDLITPSCVTLKKKLMPFFKPEFVVGKNALEWMKQDPENTIVAVKRLMGRSYNDEYVRRIIAERRVHYRLVRHSQGTENSLAVILGGKEYTPEEISAKILQKVAADAQKAEGAKAEYAVITVPAYFNDKQKYATRTAAALAGLKVRRLLPEPTAAAISFGVDNVKGEESKTVLVFDFGGGTFDLSVLTISGGQFIEQGKGGDMWLGGEDIDHLLAEYVLAKTAAEHEIDDIKGLIDKQGAKYRNRFLGELKAKVEQAKIRLSDEQSAYVEILGALKDSDGDNIDVDVELTREKFHELIAGMVDNIVRLTRKLIEDIHFTPDLIDNVLMVGGSSRIPLLIEAMKREFGAEKVLLHERPMLAIAEGAAILSHRLAEAYECPKCGISVGQSDTRCKTCGFDLEKYTVEEGLFDIVHSAAHDYYIYLENHDKYLFIEKNTPLPCERTEVFKLVHPEQKLVHMKFANVVNDVEESIGDLWLGIDLDEDKDEDKEEAEEKKAEPLQVAITLRIDENNLIEVEAKLQERPEISLSKTLSRGKADEKIFRSLEDLIDEANRTQYNSFIMTDMLYRALSIIKDAHEVIDPTTDELDELVYNRATIKIEKARRMAAEDQGSKATIYYAQTVLHDYGFALAPDKQEKIGRRVANLEKMDEYGTYEENIQALDALQKELKDLGLVGFLMEIQKAADYSATTEPAKSVKFIRALKDIMTAVSKEDKDKISRILDEIMPQALVVVRANEADSATIHKDISR